MHPHASSRSAPRRWDQDGNDTFVSTRHLVKTFQPVARRSMNRPQATGIGSWPPPIETNWLPNPDDPRISSCMTNERFRSNMTKKRSSESFAPYELNFNQPDVYHDAAEYEATRARGLQLDYELEQRPNPTDLQRYRHQVEDSTSFERHGRLPNHSVEQEYYSREMKVREREAADDDVVSRRNFRDTSKIGSHFRELERNSYEKEMPCRQYYDMSPPIRRGPGFSDKIPFELDLYEDESAALIPPILRRREYPPPVQRVYHPVSKRSQYDDDDERVSASRRSLYDENLSLNRRGPESRELNEELTRMSSNDCISQSNDYRDNSLSEGKCDTGDVSSSALWPRRSMTQTIKRPRSEFRSIQTTDELIPVKQAQKTKDGIETLSEATSSLSSLKEQQEETVRPKRRCGRKSMNFSSEQKRERNRAAVKKCRQRQALKMEYLQRKAEALATENQALSDMLVKNTDLGADQRALLTRGIQMDILLKIKEIFTQSLPKDFVLDADSIWDLNSVLAVSMPSRCYYGIESIKDFWRTSLRMRNKGKIQSFWAWLFRLPPGDRFSVFEIQPFSPKSNLYFVSWTTKSTPPLAGSMVIMFGNGHRVTLHVECFGWLIWRYLLTNKPFPEPLLD